MTLLSRLLRRKSAATATGPTVSSTRRAPFDGSTVKTDIQQGTPDPATPSTGEERSHYLVIVDGVAPGQSIELGEEALTIGRKPPSDLVLPDPRVSRRHCEIKAWRDEVRVTDLDSTNGTFVDGERVSGTISLRSGGTLQVGEHVLEHKFWSKCELREWQALIEHEETAQGAADIQIEVDAEKRQQEAQQVTENPFFRNLAAEIERLRGLQDEQAGA